MLNKPYVVNHYGSAYKISKNSNDLWCYEKIEGNSIFLNGSEFLCEDLLSAHAACDILNHLELKIQTLKDRLEK